MYLKVLRFLRHRLHLRRLMLRLCLMRRLNLISLKYQLHLKRLKLLMLRLCPINQKVLMFLRHR
jgi:hypothetical protein